MKISVADQGGAIMKKNIKNILVISILAVVALGYYYYLANRTLPQDAIEQAANNTELAALTTRDIEANYPESPKEIVDLYARITRAYYDSNTSDEKVQELGKQARLLFDDELKGTQTEEEFLKALQEDVDSYRSIKRYVSEYKIEGSSDTKYTKLNSKEYASVDMVYYIRDNSKLEYSYNRFVMRKDEKGRWKILYWKLISPEDISG